MTIVRISHDTLISEFTSAFNTVQRCLFFNYREPIKSLSNTTMTSESRRDVPGVIQTISFNTIKFTDFNKIILTMSSLGGSDQLECMLFRGGVEIDKMQMGKMSFVGINETMEILIGRNYPEKFQNLFNLTNNYLSSSVCGWKKLVFNFENFTSGQINRAVSIKSNQSPCLYFRLSYSDTPCDVYIIHAYYSDAGIEDERIDLLNQSTVSAALQSLINKNKTNVPVMRTQMLEDLINRCVRLLTNQIQ